MDISLIFKRKAINQLKEWKDTYKGKYAALLEGARRVGKSTIAEEFAKTEYRIKLYLSDTGLFVSLMLKTGKMTDTALYTKLLSDKLPANLGYLFENAIAQSITASGRDLYYMTWAKENSTHSYEVDFLISKGSKTIPIEVKSSRTTEHLSIDAFFSKYHSIVTTPYIFSQKDTGKDGQINLCPFYLSSFVFEQ